MIVLMVRMMANGPIILDPSPKKELAGKYFDCAKFEKIFTNQNKVLGLVLMFIDLFQKENFIWLV